MNPLTRQERLLALGVSALCAAALVLPSVAQPQDYHHFADARTLWGVPRALDALSNIGFLGLELYGLLLLLSGHLEFFSAALKAAAAVFFTGFITTAVGSTYYHLAPDDPGLVVDRLGMVVAFAGVLGMAAAHRVSERAGYVLTALALVLGPTSVLWWAHSGSLTAYACLQFGGIALACAMMLSEPRGPGPNWTLLLAAYALAKVCESADALIFALTAEVVSGHTLKHLLAALPVLGVTSALRRRDTGNNR